VIDVRKINVVKVFAATMVAQRAVLGEQVTEWLAAHSSCEIIDMSVTQSSDREFHCISIVVFAHDPAAASRRIGG
jgi:hypothetical protein